MATLKELRLRFYEARDALMAAETAEKDRRNAALVGKCFVARTSASCPQGPEDYWLMYGMVLAAENGCLRMFEFQRDKDGRYEIEPNVLRSSLFHGYKEIPKSEFCDAWSKLFAEIGTKAVAALGVSE